MTLAHLPNAKYANAQFAHLNMLPKDSAARALPTAPVRTNPTNAQLVSPGYSAEVVHNSLQVFQAGRNTLCRRNRCRTKFHVLLNHRPSGVAVPHKRAEKGWEINVALSDHGENFVFDGLFECPLVASRSFQYARIAILDVDETKLALILLGFLHRVAVPVNAVPSIET